MGPQPRRRLRRTLAGYARMNVERIDALVERPGADVLDVEGQHEHRAAHRQAEGGAGHAAEVGDVALVVGCEVGEDVELDVRPGIDIGGGRRRG